MGRVVGGQNRGRHRRTDRRARPCRTAALPRVRITAHGGIRLPRRCGRNDQHLGAAEFPGCGVDRRNGGGIGAQRLRRRSAQYRAAPRGRVHRAGQPHRHGVRLRRRRLPRRHPRQAREKRRRLRRGRRRVRQRRGYHRRGDRPAGEAISGTRHRRLHPRMRGAAGVRVRRWGDAYRAARRHPGAGPHPRGPPPRR